MTNSLVEQIAKTRLEDSRADATAERYAELAGEDQRKKQIREYNRLAWIQHHRGLAENHRRLSEEHRSRAEALLEGPGGGGAPHGD